MRLYTIHDALPMLPVIPKPASVKLQKAMEGGGSNHRKLSALRCLSPHPPSPLRLRHDLCLFRRRVDFGSIGLYLAKSTSTAAEPMNFLVRLGRRF